MATPPELQIIQKCVMFRCEYYHAPYVNLLWSDGRERPMTIKKITERKYKKLVDNGRYDHYTLIVDLDERTYPRDVVGYGVIYHPGAPSYKHV